MPHQYRTSPDSERRAELFIALCPFGDTSRLDPLSHGGIPNAAHQQRATLFDVNNTSGSSLCRIFRRG